MRMVDTKEQRRIPLLPLRGLLVFPTMVLHLDVGRSKSVQALEQVMKGDKEILLSTQKEISIDEPKEDEIYQIGTLAKINKLLKLPNGTVRIHVEGLKRAEIKSFIKNNTFFEVNIELLSEQNESSATEIQAITRSLTQMFEQYAKVSKKNLF